MTEQVKRWAEFKYEPVGPVVTKLMARYLRTQRKNMLRFFQERGLYEFVDRMNQIRKSRQPMLAKNRMFQEVLNSYAAQTMQAQETVPQHAGAVHDVCTAEGQSLAPTAPGSLEIAHDRVANQEPRKSAGNSEQVPGVPDSDQTIAEDL